MDPLEACAVASGLNRESISYLMFHSNQYVCKQLDHINGTSVEYLGMNIIMAKMYQFLDIILKILLISSDIDSFKSLWNTPTLATRLPTCQFKIKDYFSWTQQYMSYFRFVQICVLFYPESGIRKEGDKCHQLRNAIKHLNKAALCTFIPGKEMSFTKGNILSKSNYNPVRQHMNSKPDKSRIEKNTC